MIVRLSVVTSLLILFAISFSALVEQERRSHETVAAASPGCFEPGAICTR